ncbi:hypothetical protein OF83DRAFT_1081966 [Amylostereum chailletii]|nr:hypothetical protein OF83DRAFT_1081966 [Amylostereum chailletii]
MPALLDTVKFCFGLLMVVAVLFVAIVDPLIAKRMPSAVDPGISEWDFAWPIQTWNICWMVVCILIPGIALMMVGPLAKNEYSKEWIDYRLVFYRACFFHVCWTIGGAILMFNTKDTLAVAAPSIWNRGFRSLCLMAGGIGINVAVVAIMFICVKPFFQPAPEVEGETITNDMFAPYAEKRPMPQEFLVHTEAAPMPADTKV